MPTKRRDPNGLPETNPPAKSFRFRASELQMMETCIQDVLELDGITLSQVDYLRSLILRDFRSREAAARARASRAKTTPTVSKPH